MSSRRFRHVLIIYIICVGLTKVLLQPSKVISEMKQGILLADEPLMLSSEIPAVRETHSSNQKCSPNPHEAQSCIQMPFIGSRYVRYEHMEDIQRRRNVPCGHRADIQRCRNVLCGYRADIQRCRNILCGHRADIQRRRNVPCGHRADIQSRR